MSSGFERAERDAAVPRHGRVNVLVTQLEEIAHGQPG